MCQASMKINLINGVYNVYHFVAEHNHPLATKQQIHQLRSQRKIDEAQISRIEVAKSIGISTKAAIDLLAKEAGGMENLGFTRVDVKNRLYTKRTLKVHQGDTGGVLEYMEKKTSEDAKFFYSIQVDEDYLITNIFWADAKMVADYESYGDVVGFDTTYRKLNDGRPLGLLVGVNNHKRTIVFGAALLYDETTESFIWPFRIFLKVMSGKKSQTILRDEDEAMAKAIKQVLPDTHHWLCVWHINQNACKHLARVVKDYKKFNIEFQKCIYDQEGEEDFINAWNELRETFKVKGNKWLDQLFEKMYHWALVYGRNSLCANMSSTQRNESLNNEVKYCISVKYDMLTFFEHFNRLVRDK
jgi:zinc finger SWIM domain-containing protein 3